MLAEGSSVSSFASMQIICGVMNPSKFNHETEKKTLTLTFDYVHDAAKIRKKANNTGKRSQQFTLY